jgi:hypothetical protein
VWLVGLLVAALGIIGIFWPWCAIAAGLLTLMVVTVQYKTQGSVAVTFTASD